MYGNVSNLALLLENEAFLYLPTCVIIEIMATAYGTLFRIPANGKLSDESLALAATCLQRFLKGLKSASRAYEAGRVKTFMGDWRSDRIKAENIFNHLLTTSAKIYHRSFNPYRYDLGEMIWELKKEWEKFCSILNINGKTKCEEFYRYFRSSDPSSWQQTMANIILELHANSNYGTPDTHLLLLCNTRIKSHLIRQIETIKKKTSVQIDFDEDRILCVSDMENRMSCPMCLNFIGEIVKPSQQWGRRTLIFPKPAAVH